jgi:hypothetical protein
MRCGETNREAPAQAELRPTCAGDHNASPQGAQRPLNYPLCYLLFKPSSLTYVRRDFSLLEFLQAMEKILIVHRLANDRVEVINPFVIRGVIKCHSALA